MFRARRISYFSIDHPVLVSSLMIGLTVALVLLAGLPTVFPDKFPFLHGVQVDTNPENMLPDDEPVRLFHDRMKKEFSLYDMIVVGVINEEDPDGVFNPDSLNNIYQLTQYAKTLHWPDENDTDKQQGVVGIDIIAPSTVDNIEQGGLGQVNFQWLMQQPPQTRDQARKIREKAQAIPFLNGTLVSEDGKALALYIPLTSKDLSYRVASLLEERIAKFKGSDQFHITGLPVAEDTFGFEMFKQMAISAPLAMLVIFIMMWLFFRKTALTIPSVILAMVCASQTMSLLVISGNTIHIMSSMIPIFIIPIQVLDDIHVISEFFDRFQEGGDRRKTLLEVMDTLFAPLLFTSLTTVAGFASLALTPIPPVQVFGIFVAIGVMLAWFWTITFIPAALMLFPEKWIKNLSSSPKTASERKAFGLTPLLHTMGKISYRHAWSILAVVIALIALSAYGISLIRVNDNPTKWFEKDHPIRVADRILNKHFGGTYMAYLSLNFTPEKQSLDEYAASLTQRLKKQEETLGDVKYASSVFSILGDQVEKFADSSQTETDLLDKLQDFADRKYNEVDWDRTRAWEEARLALDRELQRYQVFKQPQMLDYIDNLQQYMQNTEEIGKSNSVADIVQTVHRELFLGKDENFRIPDSADAVAQTLITYQNSHRPQDLWHLVTPDYQRTNIWVQLKSGDNRVMQDVVERMDNYLEDNEPPFAVEHDWFGLTYINVIWQDKMVKGMLKAFLGSFLVVLLMMTFLFRSALWGLLSMIPLVVTIAFIYGVIGLIGKDYDMPVAVLSSLSLGLAVDYAIHFLARTRSLWEKSDSWQQTVNKVFGEPARAISRNVIVVGMGFLPLLAAPLVPYRTVGIFIAAILFTAGFSSLLVLPAIISVAQNQFFPLTEKREFFCRCGRHTITFIAASALIVINVQQFMQMETLTLFLVGLGLVLAMMAICRITTRQLSC